jgi:hypothetical protein
MFPLVRRSFIGLLRRLKDSAESCFNAACDCVLEKAAFKDDKSYVIG